MQPNAPFFPDQEIIVLAKNGIWYADGIEISHEPTRKLFAKSLQRDKTGYFLRIGRESKRITVEDTPYFVLRIEGTPSTGVTVLLNDETQESLDPSTLKYSAGRLICSVKTKAEARFLSAAYYDLLSHLKEDPHGYYLPFSAQAPVYL